MLIDAGPGYHPKIFEVDGEPAKRFKGVLNALWDNVVKPKAKAKANPAPNTSVPAPPGSPPTPKNPATTPVAVPPQSQPAGNPVSSVQENQAEEPQQKHGKVAKGGGKGGAGKTSPVTEVTSVEVPQATAEQQVQVVQEAPTSGKVTLADLKVPFGMKVVLDGSAVILESQDTANRRCPKDTLLKTFNAGKFSSTADQVPPNSHIYDLSKTTTLVWSSDLSAPMPLIDLVKKKGRVGLFLDFLFLKHELAAFPSSKRLGWWLVRCVFFVVAHVC